MTTTVTICDTCKRPGWESGSGETDGERLAALVEREAAGTGLKVRRHSCLMGCDGACNVAVQAPGKMCYTLGRFAPGPEAAEGIVAYAALHAAAETGVVPYRDWPAAIKGHFVTRHPPLPAA
jgi:predicted metal-binding protein